MIPAGKETVENQAGIVVIKLKIMKHCSGETS